MDHTRRCIAAAFLCILGTAFSEAPARAAVASVNVPGISADPPLTSSEPVSTWSNSASLTLAWDVVHARPAQEETTVHVATDGKFLYVRFDAKQAHPVVVSQRSNDLITGGSVGYNGTLSWSNDDAVWVDIWPTGPGGFQYQFESNPDGFHNESSSENLSFAPHWESHGDSHDGGYTVTMAIPLSVVRGSHAGGWGAQFVRYVRATGAEYVWSYQVEQTNADDPGRAGNLVIPSVTAIATVPKPRLAVYGLGSLASASVGGSTSRMGADLSIPVTPTSSFFATFHPDYSNVELDQQSISPQVYERLFSEVRPFFTQAASYYNGFNCDVCNGYRTTLYTPAIPTPSQGYAFEGKQGAFGFAAFDAIGDDRADVASVLDYVSPDTRWKASFQHVAADIPDVVDDTNQVGVNWSNLKHLSGYINYANETGTNVLDASQGRWINAGGGWTDQHFGLYGSVQSVGGQFNPVDGFDSHPGVAGYALAAVRVWTFAPQSKLQSMGISSFMDRYQGQLYGIAQSDNALTFDVLTKSAWDLQLNSGSDYWRFGQILSPISQNGGVSLTYHSGSQDDVGSFPAHGTSATPTQIQYFTGRYGEGRLDTWYRSSTIRVGNRGSLTLAVDNTSQWLRNTPDNIQWFDSVAYSYQIGRGSSIALGIRRVIGAPPQPNGGGNCTGACSNISIAYYLRLRDEELYFAYGDPNTLTTVPQALLKVIFYVSAQKGT